MGINVALVDERHEPRQEVFDPGFYLTKLASGEWSRMEGSVCLRFVDFCGDTVFNQAQLPHLLAELERSAATQWDEKVKDHLRKVCRLVRQAQGKTHMYIKFIGD